MPDDQCISDQRAAFARELTRRRLIASFGVAAAIGFTSESTFAVQTATPSPEQAEIDQLLALSKELCGGGTFDQAQAAVLLHLLKGDAKLGRGLTELQAIVPAEATPANPRTIATPAAARSSEAQAAAEAILLFWYAGVFNGDPIQDRSSVYTNLLAWQAMYTPAWTTCKLFGGWADPPSLTPQVPENA